MLALGKCSVNGWIVINVGFGLIDHDDKLTVTLLTIPYVSHKVFGSNAALHALVCSVERSMGFSVSRLLAGDAQLPQMSHVFLTSQVRSSPSTPPADYSGNQDLFRVVRNVWPERVDGTTVMTIWTFNDVRLGHEWFQGVENRLQGFMHQLPAKGPEHCTVSILLAT